MWGRSGSSNLEILFSFEFWVDHIRIDGGERISDELALGLRLLDFPTLLIYQPERGRDEMKRAEAAKGGERAFRRGKSCLFKMNPDSLHRHLSNTPLYAMVLDVKDEVPRLVGTSLISVAEVMDRIRQDVTEQGVCVCSSHGESGLVSVSNLTGETVGSITLSYKLLTLGASAVQRVTAGRQSGTATLPGGQNAQEGFEKNNLCTKPPAPDYQKVQSLAAGRSDGSSIHSNRLSHENTLVNESFCESTQREHKPKNQNEDIENCFSEDLNVLCPPCLYYSNSDREISKKEGGDYKVLIRETMAFASEDTFSENEIQAPVSSVVEQSMRQTAKMSSNQEASVASPNILREALRELPLLNALLVELSRLNGPNPHQHQAVHPSLAGTYMPASTESSDGQRNTPQKQQTKAAQDSMQRADLYLKQLHSPRNCSTPVEKSAFEGRPINNREEALIERAASSKSRKKLVYGTTKTFNLRWKKNSAFKGKHHECVGLIETQAQPSLAKGRTQCCTNVKAPRKKKSAPRQTSDLSENTTKSSAVHGATPPKQMSMHANKTMSKSHGKQDRESPCTAGRDMTGFPVPTVDGNIFALNKVNIEHHSESNQSRSESDSHRRTIESSGISRHNSQRSLFSNPSGEGGEDADYADDFNSLESGDTCSLDAPSTPEPAQARTRKSPAHPDSCGSDPGSKSTQNRATPPAPIKTCSSQQRVLRGTHIIRPQTLAPSFSSDDGSASTQDVCFREQMMDGSGAERSSGAESFKSSRGRRSESSRSSSSPVRGCSVESVSSLEPQEAEEVEDELGSLDFRKEYQHISELVSGKLPGYTM